MPCNNNNNNKVQFVNNNNNKIVIFDCLKSVCYFYNNTAIYSLYSTWTISNWKNIFPLGKKTLYV